MKISKTLFTSLMALPLCTLCFAQGSTDWYTPTTENKPFVRWWWLGSAVDKEGLTYNLEEFAKAGIDISRKNIQAIVAVMLYNVRVFWIGMDFCDANSIIFIYHSYIAFCKHQVIFAKD